MNELFGNMMKYADKEKPYFILVSSTESQIVETSGFRVCR